MKTTRHEPFRRRVPAGAVLTVNFVLAALLLVSCGGDGDHGVGADKPDEDVIKVSADVQKEIGIKTEAVERRKLNVFLHVTGRIQPDVGREVKVNTRFSGRVMEVRVVPGEFVVPGQVLATVDSQQISDLQAELIEARSKLHIAEAQEERERQIYEENLQRPKALIQARTHFDESKVQLELAESEFKRQEGLYKEKISSAKDYLTAKANLAKAKAAFAQAQVELQREERMYANKALMKRDYQLAQAETARARQHSNTLRQRLEFLGVSPNMVHAVLDTGKILAEVPVTSPASGVVTQQGISVGEVIDPDKVAFTITDLSSVVVTADLPEVEVSKVKIGSRVKVHVASYPDRVFEGTINYISEVVNPETRTVAIRARLSNDDRRLKAHMFAEIDIIGEPSDLLACPKSAVQERDNQRVVYVLTPEGFKEQEIETRAETEHYYEVVSGLKEGEKVATEGSLMLKTELTYQH